MKTLAQLILIILLAGIAIIGIIPGCDELVTQENFYYDTIYLQQNYFYDTISYYYIDSFFDTTIIILQDSTCIEYCHADTGSHLQYVNQQWAYSRHAGTSYFDMSIGSSSSLDCGPECHTREGYISKISGVSLEPEIYTEIGCFACHAPHSNFAFIPLRKETPVTLAGGEVYDKGNSNTCAECHKSIETHAILFLSDTIDTEWMTWAQHGSTQADDYSGLGAYEYAGETYNSSHAAVVGSACLACHQSNSSIPQLGGHSLNIRNEYGIILDQCNVMGCHEGDVMTEAEIDSYQLLHSEILDTLGARLFEAGLLDTTDAGIYIPKESVEVTDAQLKGAIYNYFYIRNDKSRGIHNWVFDTTLIRSSSDSVLIYLGDLP